MIPTQDGLNDLQLLADVSEVALLDGPTRDRVRAAARRLAERLTPVLPVPATAHSALPRPDGQRRAWRKPWACVLLLYVTATSWFRPTPWRGWLGRRGLLFQGKVSMSQ
jgi:hypothetical protein